MSKEVLHGIRRTLMGTLLIIGVLWVFPLLVPAESDVRFGVPFAILGTIVVSSAFLFFLLIRVRTSMPRSAWVSFGNILIVALFAIGVPLLIGVSYPQFELPQAEVTEEVNREAAERGKELFLSPSVACFACHSIQALDIRGGERGPDLSGIGERASTRVPGLSAQEYVREHIKRGSDPDFFTVPEYAPIMPPFGDRLSEEQLDNLVAFLASLRQGNSTASGVPVG